jgi:ketosteroid isomerase-like protein
VVEGPIRGCGTVPRVRDRVARGVDKVVVLANTTLMLLGLVAYVSLFGPTYHPGPDACALGGSWPTFVLSALIVMGNPVSFGAFLGDRSAASPPTPAPRGCSLPRSEVSLPVSLGLAAVVHLALLCAFPESPCPSPGTPWARRDRGWCRQGDRGAAGDRRPACLRAPGRPPLPSGARRGGGRPVTQRADATDEVRQTAALLVAAFGRGDLDRYLDCFREDATFLFHTTDRLLASRKEYRRERISWVRDDGFQVLGWGDLRHGRPDPRGHRRPHPRRAHHGVHPGRAGGAPRAGDDRLPPRALGALAGRARAPVSGPPAAG